MVTNSKPIFFVKAQDIGVASIESIQSLNLYIDFYYYMMIYIKASDDLYWFHGYTIMVRSILVTASIVGNQIQKQCN